MAADEQDGASSAAGGLAELVLNVKTGCVMAQRPERRAATPALDASGEEVGSWGMSEGVAELLMRPTGILDPAVHVRPSAGQADDLLGEVHTRIARGERSLVSVVTKVAAEELSAFLKGHGVRSAYMHSDVKALDRMSILEALKDGRCKPFRVVQAKTIRQLAIHQPRSEKELLDVFGIGPVKLEDFGSQLLMLVEDASAAESA
eukprot:gene9110-10795_t